MKDVNLLAIDIAKINFQLIVDNLLKSLDQIFPTLTFQRTDDWQTAISLHPHVGKLLNVYSIKATEKNKSI